MPVIRTSRVGVVHSRPAPDSALSRAAGALKGGGRRAVSLRDGLGRLAGWWYRTSFDNPAALQWPASSHARADGRIRAESSAPLGRLPGFGASEAICEPGFPGFAGFGTIRGRATSWPRIRWRPDRVAQSTAATGRVRARFVRTFGCVAPWLAGRCRRRRPSHVSLGRELGTVRRVRLGDGGW